ncbi:MAG: Rrf2 family transcriptional regulator [Aquamicrobium sp.]|uniref:Rrf2 family transcriptional regulator n=1 Tax=Aquamicrobium sp. TaxID=1872579 RepID=UPI00349EF5A5|nr:Rrf2 family transcriptional regulator [Aquamicrobium sp.]MCO5156835.1 Rrf2 family transcriptional regulator [Aquamicrobium sp.]
MRMTLHTDYALRMLIYLASRPGRICTVSEVADAYRLSRNHLLKVALRLRRMGFIDTTRGRAGGIRLAKNPSEINLGVLVRGTEEDFSLVECMQGTGGSCVISPICRLKGIFGEALEAYLAVLDRYTLADATRNHAGLKILLGLDAEAA